MSRGSFGNFEITSSISDFEMSLGDSLFIDASKYWRGDIGCQKRTYKPNISRISSSKEILELRSYGEYAIIKALELGETNVSISAETLSSTDECDYVGISNSSLNFSIKVVDDPVNTFVSASINTNMTIQNVFTEPSSFSFGDTVMVKINPELNISQYDFYWVIDYPNKILDDFTYCSAYHDSEFENFIEVVIGDSLGIMNGYVNISYYASERNEGITFNLHSE
ncbi:MAG: hypothetical protein RLN83_08810 [Balneola sp.]